jgi:hypothetical protein
MGWMTAAGSDGSVGNRPVPGVAMQWVDLIVLACRLTNPSACTEYHLMMYQEVASLRACTMEAQPYLAQWIGEHPHERVARWRCAWPDGEGKKI